MASMDSDYEWYGDGYSEKLFCIEDYKFVSNFKRSIFKNR